MDLFTWPSLNYYQEARTEGASSPGLLDAKAMRPGKFGPSLLGHPYIIARNTGQNWPLHLAIFKSQPRVQNRMGLFTLQSLNYCQKARTEWASSHGQHYIIARKPGKNWPLHLAIFKLQPRGQDRMGLFTGPFLNYCQEARTEWASSLGHFYIMARKPEFNWPLHLAVFKFYPKGQERIGVFTHKRLHLVSCSVSFVVIQQTSAWARMV